MVAAPGKAGIYEAAIPAVNGLIRGHRGVVGVTFAVSGPAGGLTVAAQSGQPSGDRLTSLVSSRKDVRKSLDDGRPARCAIEATPLPLGLAHHDSPEQVLICPLLAKDTLQRMIAVTTVSPLPVEVTNTIETLAAQVALALDRETLTETFHARRSEARFQTLVRSASDVILIARPDTTITYQTPSAKSVLGYEPASLQGQRLTNLLHPDDVEQALAVYAAVTLRAGAPLTAQWRIRHKQGSWSHFDVVVNNLLDDVTV